MAILRASTAAASQTSSEAHGVIDAELDRLATAAAACGLGNIDPIVRAVRRGDFDLIFQSGPAAPPIWFTHGIALPRLVLVADNVASAGGGLAAWRQRHLLLPQTSLAVVCADGPTVTTYEKIAALARWCRRLLFVLSTPDGARVWRRFLERQCPAPVQCLMLKPGDHVGLVRVGAVR